MKKFSLLSVMCCAMALTHCSPVITTHGNFPEKEALEQIRLKQHTREDVMRLLGSPTNVSEFKGRDWYYIARKTSANSFLTPETLETMVVQIHFNQQGTAESVKVHDEAKGLPPIEWVERATTTPGHDMTFMQKMFGNFGRFGPSIEGAKKER